MTYVQREIEVTFTGKGKVLTFSNLRMSARVRVGGAPGMGQAEVAIYGLSLSHMNDLCTYGRAIHIYYDYWIEIKAGDKINGMSTIFIGQVTQAWGDFQSMPDVPFHVVALMGLTPQVQSTPQMWTSYSGPTDVATMLKTQASNAHLEFENNGVNTKLDSPYHYGPPRVQIRQICEAAHVGWCIENNILAVWAPDKTRGSTGLTFSKDSGLVKYPTFTEYGILVMTEYAKPIKYNTTFTVKSSLTPANRSWAVALLDYDLQCRMPNGHWFLTLGATVSGGEIPFMPGG